MPNQMFYLTAQNWEKVRQLPNMSSLINNLLSEHFELISKVDPTIDSIELQHNELRKQMKSMEVVRETLLEQNKEREELAEEDGRKEIEQNEKDSRQLAIGRNSRTPDYWTTNRQRQR